MADTLPSGSASEEADSSPPRVSTSRLKREAFKDWMESSAPAIPSEDGKYQRQGVVGEGGMGVVLRVEDRDLRRVVAMKVLSRGNTSAEDMARFLREAQITGQLEHPHIVPVHDMGLNEAGEPYFTMKLSRGERTLRDVIGALHFGGPAEHARYSFRWRVEVVRKLLSALSYAHARGVVHRDIKPENVLVGTNDEVYLADWGIARVIQVEGSLGADPPEQEAVAGTGTPAYMSPEQAQGQPPTPQDDVYSLAAVLYELLSLKNYLGVIPAQAPESILKALRERPRRVPSAERHWHAIQGHVPRTLSRILSRALAYEASERYTSAEELDADLMRWLAGDCPVVCPGTALQRGISGWSKWIDRHPVLTPILSYAALIVAGGFMLYGVLNALRQ